MAIIAFGHQKGVGKDCLAHCLGRWMRSVLGRHSVKVSFADRLYETCRVLYECEGFRTKDYYDLNREAKETPLPDFGKTPREILLEVGQHLREYDKDIFLRHIVQMHRALAGKALIIVPDLRFENEVEMLRSFGEEALLIRVVRPSLEPTADKADTALDSYDGWDYTFENTAPSLYKLEHEFGVFCNHQLREWIKAHVVPIPAGGPWPPL